MITEEFKFSVKNGPSKQDLIDAFAADDNISSKSSKVTFEVIAGQLRCGYLVVPDDTLSNEPPDEVPHDTLRDISAECRYNGSGNDLLGFSKLFKSFYDEIRSKEC